MSISEQPRATTAATARFPADFTWGVATSAYQIEGAVDEDGRGPSIWDVFCTLPGKVKNGDSGAIAADHYHHMEDDVALMSALGLGAYRFSIAWPRIVPMGRGAINQKGLDFYDRLVDALLAKGIAPAPTLFHWDLPQALQERGGWLSRDTAYAFADYADIVGRRLGDRISMWITHNEPRCSSYLSHGMGIHAPGIRDTQAAINSAHYILLSHGLAAQRLRGVVPTGTKIGITIDFSPIYGVDDSPATLEAVRQAHAFRNAWFGDPVFLGHYPANLFQEMGGFPPPVQPGDMEVIATPLDFLGVNYYSRELVQARHDDGVKRFVPDTYQHVKLPTSEYTEMGWEVFPEGLTVLLKQLHQDYAPPMLLVTENGAAYDDHLDASDAVHDAGRVSYLGQHVQALASAIQAGVPLKGYFVWSLMDNFEWAEGYGKRFGIVYVDYATQQRIVKDSGRWYAEFIADQHQQGTRE